MSSWNLLLHNSRTLRQDSANFVKDESQTFIFGLEDQIVAEAHALSRGLFVTAIMARLISIMGFDGQPMEAALALNRRAILLAAFVEVVSPKVVTGKTAVDLSCGYRLCFGCCLCSSRSFWHGVVERAL